MSCMDPSLEDDLVKSGGRRAPAQAEDPVLHILLQKIQLLLPTLGVYFVFHA